MTPELLAVLTVALSAFSAFGATVVALRRSGSQNTHDDATAAESVSNATITLIAPLRRELETTQKELTLTREQLKKVQTQLEETVTALHATKNDVLMFQSEIRLLTTQNNALTLRVTELEAENLRLHKQIDDK